MRARCGVLLLVVAAPMVAAGQGRVSHGIRPDTAAFSLDVNLPAYRVDAHVDGRTARTFPVAIGMRRYKTPVGRYTMDWLEWNPWWIPPKSEWARKDTVTPPGPQNPMGRAKLSIGAMYFLHGTPLDASIGRAESHGCLRMHNADVVQLALWVLEQARALPDSLDVASLVADLSTTRRVSLGVLVPVTVRYDVVEWREDRLLVHPDVYRRGAPTVTRAMAVLASAGVDTTHVRRARLAALVRRGARRSTGWPVDSLTS